MGIFGGPQDVPLPEDLKSPHWFIWLLFEFPPRRQRRRINSAPPKCLHSAELYYFSLLAISREYGNVF